MEDIKVRDYVRTIDGEIFKIVGMKRNKGLTMYLTDNYAQYSDTVLMQCAKAHSKQIEIIKIYTKEEFEMMGYEVN